MPCLRRRSEKALEDDLGPHTRQSPARDLRAERDIAAVPLGCAHPGTDLRRVEPPGAAEPPQRRGNVKHT